MKDDDKEKHIPVKGKTHSRFKELAKLKGMKFDFLLNYLIDKEVKK